MKKINIFLFSALFLWLPIHSNDATSAELPKQSDCAVVDGPANLRKTQKGSVILSIPDNSTVLVQKIVGDWVEVSGILESEKNVHCYGKDDLDENKKKTGWLHINNFKNATWEERVKLDNVGALLSEKGNFRPHFKITMKTDCSCASLIKPDNDMAKIQSRTWKVGQIFGNNCEISERVATCTVSEGSETHTHYCPVICISASEAQALTPTDKDRIFSTKASEERAKLEIKFSGPLKAALKLKYPNWIPLLIPNITRSTNYEYLFHSLSSYGKFNFGLQSTKKESELFVFFENLEKAKNAQPTVAFEGDKDIQFRQFPFDLNESKGDHYSPFLCFSEKSKMTILFACRSVGEAMPPIGGFDLRDKIPQTSSWEQVEKTLDSITKSSQNGYCCTRDFFRHFGE